MTHCLPCLCNDGPLIKISRCKMWCRSDRFYTSLIRIFIGPCSFKCWEQCMMHINNRIGWVSDEVHLERTFIYKQARRVQDYIFGTFCDSCFSCHCITCIWNMMIRYPLSCWLAFLWGKLIIHGHVIGNTLLCFTRTWLRQCNSREHRRATSQSTTRRRINTLIQIYLENICNISIYAVETAFISFPDIASKKCITFCMCLRFDYGDIWLIKTPVTACVIPRIFFTRKCERCLGHKLYFILVTK